MQGRDADILFKEWLPYAMDSGFQHCLFVSTAEAGHCCCTARPVPFERPASQSNQRISKSQSEGGFEAALAVSGQTRIHWESSPAALYVFYTKRNLIVARKTEAHQLPIRFDRRRSKRRSSFRSNRSPASHIPAGNIGHVSSGQVNAQKRQRLP